MFPPVDAPPSRARPRLLDRVRGAPATFALVALDLAGFAWTFHLGPPPEPWGFFDVDTLVRAGALERSQVWAGEPWRLAAAVFLHAGLVHLALNVIFGVPWCRGLERALGSRRFLTVYVTSGLAASASSLLLQDRVSVGASGALFGVIGAALALHRRALGSWRAFLTDRGTIVLGVQLAIWAAIGAAGLPLDQWAHTGGLAAGWATAWLMTRPAPRGRLAWAVWGAALLALCAAAAWPRSAPTRWQTTAAERDAERVDREVFAAWKRGDETALRRLVAAAGVRGVDPPLVRLFRGHFLAVDGNLAGALELLRPLAADGPEAIREPARHDAAWAAARLAYSAYRGIGGPADPERGLAYLEEACGYGDEASCRRAEAIRGRAGPPPAR